MSNIIVKPKGVQFSHKKASFEIIFEEPYYIGLAYADGKQIHIKKFKDNKIADGWKELESLTDYPCIVFLDNTHNKVIQKNIDNLCPIPLNDCAYVASGEVLNLRKKLRKQFTDVFYFKQYGLNVMEKSCPSVFFAYQGRWLLHRFLPTKTAMAFLGKDGQFSIINSQNGYEFEKMWYFDTDCVNTKAKK